MFVLGKEFGDPDDGGDFHELGGLHVEKAEVNPAFGAVEIGAENEYEDEQTNASAVDKVAESGVISVVDGGAWNGKKDESEREPEELCVVEGFWQDIGNTGEVKDADADDGCDEKKENPVDRFEREFHDQISLRSGWFVVKDFAEVTVEDFHGDGACVR